MPPALFKRSTHISAVLASGAPRFAAGPVTAKIAPTLIGAPGAVDFAGLAGVVLAPEAGVEGDAGGAFFAHPVPRQTRETTAIDRAKSRALRFIRCLLISTQGPPTIHPPPQP